MESKQQIWEQNIRMEYFIIRGRGGGGGSKGVWFNGADRKVSYLTIAMTAQYILQICSFQTWSL